MLCSWDHKTWYPIEEIPGHLENICIFNISVCLRSTRDGVNKKRHYQNRLATKRKNCEQYLDETLHGTTATLMGWNMTHFVEFLRLLAKLWSYPKLGSTLQFETIVSFLLRNLCHFTLVTCRIIQSQYEGCSLSTCWQGTDVCWWASLSLSGWIWRLTLSVRQAHHIHGCIRVQLPGARIFLSPSVSQADRGLEYMPLNM